MSERTSAQQIVIVGGGKAGGEAAVALRDEGFDGPIVLISREPEIPYGRPPLSKTYLKGDEGLDGWYVRPPDWYAVHNVDLQLESAVTAIDVEAHSMTLGSGRQVPYQQPCWRREAVIAGSRSLAVTCREFIICARSRSATRSRTRP